MTHQVSIPLAHRFRRKSEEPDASCHPMGLSLRTEISQEM